MEMKKIVPQQVIAGERFDLRPLHRPDLALVELYASDPRVACNTTTIPHPLPPGLIEGFIERAMAEPRDADVWAIDGSRTGLPEVMGLISLSRLDRNQSEVGYWVAPTFWNIHLASEAVNALVLANPLGNGTMFAEVFHDNPASARVLTNAGFQYLGDAETFCVARNCTVPTWTYSRKLL